MSERVSYKLKLLHLSQILQQESDENHPLSAPDLCERLERLGILCERKSIYSDINNLIAFGLDVIHTRTPKNGWFIATRQFELPEVRVLIDAVQAASFITPKKTKELLKKLETLVSVPQADDIQNQVYIDKRVKCKNEEIYYSIDLLHRAIQEGKQVQFLYQRRELSQSGPDVSERKFVVNPYAMLWANDHYYLVCNHPKYDDLMHTRIDRMYKVQILDTPARHFSEVCDYRERFDTADYAEKLFHMFSGKAERIELICSNKIIEELLDRFGERAKLTKYSDTQVLLRAEAAVSKGLVSWILQYGSDIQVKAPESLKRMYLNKLVEIIKTHTDKKE